MNLPGPNVSGPNVSIIVPTYREALNLPLLVQEIAHSMAARGWVWELIIVDDNSQDGTPAVLERLAASYPQFRFTIRVGQRGLSSAVLAGIAMARHTYITVMDADLSHPPESIPTLIDKLENNQADFVIGSRYVAGGGTQDWTRFRWLNSAGATVLSRPFARGVCDPMAGFFALRRAALEAADPLNPIGYKIGLELMAKCRVGTVAEVPIIFRQRVHGQSKLTVKEQFRYLEHLSRLYDYKFPKGSPRAKFLIAAALGAAVCLGAVALLDALHCRFAIAMAAGLLGMILVTLLFFVRYVRTQRDFIAMKDPYWEFLCISIGEFLFGFVTATAMPVANNFLRAAAGIIAVLIVRYILRKVFMHDIRGIRGTRNPADAFQLSFNLDGTPRAPSAA